MYTQKVLHLLFKTFNLYRNHEIELKCCIQIPYLYNIFPSKLVRYSNEKSIFILYSVTFISSIQLNDLRPMIIILMLNVSMVVMWKLEFNVWIEKLKLSTTFENNEKLRWNLKNFSSVDFLALR
jgi:hypothetical protein